ncbi:MAG: hypothetical protein ACN6O6_23120 [Pseudomonas sp.]|uniref:hypothetical protein n=1 Tax=Pseudomonas sp. TaxID=306 RepID=UPI003D139109
MRCTDVRLFFPLLVLAASPGAAVGAPVVQGIGTSKCEYLTPEDFTTSASVGQWVLGYYSGALNMNIGFALSQGMPDEVTQKAADFDVPTVLESVRAFCVSNPSIRLYQAASGIVTMVLE